MAKQIKLDIVTPEKVAYSEDVNMVIARTTAGDIGILPGHAALIAALAIWPLRIITDSGEIQMAMCGGFIEVQPEKITILANCAEMADEIDVNRAEAAKERAEVRIRTSKDEIDMLRAEAALRRAMTRLQVVNYSRQHKM